MTLCMNLSETVTEVKIASQLVTRMYAIYMYPGSSLHFTAFYFKIIVMFSEFVILNM